MVLVRSRNGLEKKIKRKKKKDNSGMTGEQLPKAGIINDKSQGK